MQKTVAKNSVEVAPTRKHSTRYYVAYTVCVFTACMMLAALILWGVVLWMHTGDTQRRLVNTAAYLGFVGLSAFVVGVGAVSEWKDD